MGKGETDTQTDRGEVLAEEAEAVGNSCVSGTSGSVFWENQEHTSMLPALSF